MEKRKLMLISDKAMDMGLIGHCGWNIYQAERLRRAMLERDAPMISSNVTVQEVFDAVCLLLQERFELNESLGW